LSPTEISRPPGSGHRIHAALAPGLAAQQSFHC
jgi:hypothetical protein